MHTPAATQAQLIELCSMLRAIAVSRKDAGTVLRQMAETYEVRATIDKMPQYGS
jgi:hypothetical protein